MEKYLLVLLAVAGGIIMAFQPPVNSALARFTGVIESSAISFTVGAISLLIVSFFIGQGSIMKLTEAPPYLLIGGILGAIFVTINIFVIPKLGSVVMMVCVIIGQMIAALIIDQFGLLGLAQHTITWTRIVGIILMLAGLRFVLIK